MKRNISALRMGSHLRGSLPIKVSYWPSSFADLSKETSASLAARARWTDDRGNSSLLCMTKWLGDELQRVVFPNYRDRDYQRLGSREYPADTLEQVLASITKPQRELTIVLPDKILTLEGGDDYNIRFTSMYGDERIPLTGKLTLNAAMSSFQAALGFLAPAGSLVQTYHSPPGFSSAHERRYAFGDQSEVVFILRPDGVPRWHPKGKTAASTTPPVSETEGQGKPAPGSAGEHPYHALQYKTDERASEIDWAIGTAFWLTGSCNANRNPGYDWAVAPLDKRPVVTIKLYPTDDASSMETALRTAWHDERVEYLKQVRRTEPNGVEPEEEQLVVKVMTPEEASKIRLSPL